jgi:serine/threonine protein kinase
MRAVSSTPKSGYLRVSALATGGMAQVDIVVKRDLGFERIYAMKRLLPQAKGDDAFVDMFLDEARIAGRIRHANVVSVLDVGSDDEGPFLVMDYVEGVTLTKLIQHHKGRGELLPLQLVLAIAIQIAEGLHAAHELVDRDGKLLHLVHRDVSPSNVLVGFDGVVRVTDFGIAKAIGQTTKTSTGIIKGKPGYLSPEQLRFEVPDRRSDLFAMGVSLYEMLSLERLYQQGDELSGLRRILNEPPPDFGELRDDVPPELVELGFELLAKLPEDRPPTARAVAERLQDQFAELVATEGLMSLAEHMDDALGDRKRAERERLAEELRALEVEPVPEADDKTEPDASNTRGATSVSRSMLLPFAIAAVLFGAGLGVTFLLQARGTPESEAKPTEDAVPTTIVLTIDSDPSGANVIIDGQPAGATPTKAALSRSSTAVALSIVKEGFDPVQRSFVPDGDQMMHVALTRQRSPEAKAAPPRPRKPPRQIPKPAATSSAGLFRRFD